MTDTTSTDGLDIPNEALVATAAVLTTTEVPPAPTAVPEETATVVDAAATKTQFLNKFSETIDKFNDSQESIYLPSAVTKLMTTIIEAMPNMDNKTNPDFIKWATAIKESLAFSDDNNILLGSLQREGSLFKQHLDVNDDGAVLLEPRALRLADTRDTQLKGESAKARLSSYVGFGNKYQVPLYHSGFWITLKAPTEIEIIQLFTAIGNVKIEYGRSLKGMINASTSIVITDKLVNFVVDHIYNSTLKSFSGDFKTIIDIRDVYTLFWGMACVMYPRGFQYRRGCLTDPEKCNHVVEEKLNLSKLLWVDNKMPDICRKHMASRAPNSMSMESVEQYKLNFNNDTEVKFTTDDGLILGFKLTNPTVDSYITIGYNWVNSVCSRIETIIGDDVDPAEKKSAIELSAKATALRAYAHYVSAINLVDENNIIDDPDTIQEELESLSGHDRLRKELFKEIIKFIDTSSHSVIGIPAYKCPACGKDQDHYKEGEFVNVIPLDVPQVFFSILFQKLSVITGRSDT